MRILAATFFALSLFPGLAAAADAPDLSKVTLTEADATNIGAHTRMVAAGVLNNIPYTMKWAQFAGATQVVEALRSGSVDIGYGSDSAAIFGLAAGTANGYVMVIAMPMVVPRDGAIVVLGDSPIKTVADLKGKKLAATPGTGSQYMSEEWLQHANMTLKDVTPVNLAAADALAALSSHQIDGWATYSPFIGVATADHGMRVITDNDPVPGSISVLFASTKSLADPTKRAAIADFLVRLRDAHIWMKSHQADWQKDMAKVTGMDQPTSNDAAIRVTRDVVPIDASIMAATQAQADTFFQLGVLPKRVIVNTNVWDDEFNNMLFPKK